MIKRLMGALCLLAAGMAITPAARAQEITAATVEAWADKAFGETIEAGRMTGAEIVVVQGGRVIFQRGYGYADYVARTPMDPEATRVRICSLTKLVVATALMQLVEQGRIRSLDDPANMYLKRIQLPAYRGRQITLRDLTTHRAGLEDSYFNAGTTETVEAPVPGPVLQRLLPQMVREPGTLSVYSNASAAIQGAIIEDVTGMPLRAYLAQNVFGPLGMTRTELNIGPPMPEGTAHPYILYENGAPRAVEIVAKSPVYAASGGVFSTASDMTRFVMAHMNTSGQGPSILSPASLATMHAPYVRNHPGVGALGVQFFVEDLNGERVLSHSGALPGFTAYLTILPERDVGLFISVISAREPVPPLREIQASLAGGEPVETGAIEPNFATRFHYLFLREFIGFPRPEVNAAAEADLRPYFGLYKVERRSHRDLLAGMQLFAPNDFMLRVEAHPDGGLMISKQGPFRGIAPDVFQRGEHPGQVLGFGRGPDGRARYILRSTAQVHSRVEPWEDSAFLQTLIGWSLVALLSGLAVWLWPKGAGAPKRAALLCCVIALACVGVMLALTEFGFAPGKTIEDYINEGHAARLWAIAGFGNLAALACVALAFLAIRFWATGKGPVAATLAAKAHLTILGFAGLATVFVFGSTNLIGFNLP